VRPLLLSLLRQFVLLPSYLLVLLVRLGKWLIAPLALLFQLLIGVPLVLLRIRQPVRPHFIPMQESELPNAAWIALTDATETLTADGFVQYGDFRCDELIQNTVLWLRLLGQPERGIGAIVAQVQTRIGTCPSRQFVEFSTTFEDGRVLDTNNFYLPYSLPNPPYLARLQLKDVWDPRALYVLHRELVASLAQPISMERIERATRDPIGLLIDGHVREIQSLCEGGWLQASNDSPSVRLSWRGALIGVWRQAWPLASSHLLAADRRARRLLAEYGLDVTSFTGSATSIVVDRQALPEGTVIETVGAGYEQIRLLAQRTDPGAVLEGVVVELENQTSGKTTPRELRYSFRSCDRHAERRMRRIHSFDILVEPNTGRLSVTAMDRDFEHAHDEAEWVEWGARSPLQPLYPGPWLRDLDSVLPSALAQLANRASGECLLPDSASLFVDEHGAPCWQIVAWAQGNTPVHVTLDARL